MSEKKLKLTIDTNLINARQGLPAMNKLEQWRNEEKIIIVGTTRLNMEIAQYKNQKAIDKAKAIPNMSEPLVLGRSFIGSCYIGSGNKNSPQFWDFSEVLFPEKKYKELSDNEANDVMHLMSHDRGRSDIFITNNLNDFIKHGKRERLAQLGVIVKTAEEVVSDLSAKNGWT